MVAGMAGTDLMQLIFDVDPDAEHPAPRPWTPEPAPSTAAVTAVSVANAVALPLRHLAGIAEGVAKAGPGQLAGALAQRAAALANTAPAVARQALHRPGGGAQRARGRPPRPARGGAA